MIDWLCIFFSVWGFYFAVLRLFCKSFEQVFKKDIFRGGENSVHFFLFLSFLAWAVSNGLMSLIPAWEYFADISLASRYSLNGLIGFLLLVVGWPVIYNYRKVGAIIHSIRLERKEKFLLSFIAIVLLIYVYRVTVPWGDHDEALCYGYLSKLMAGGRTFRDIFREDFLLWSWSQLVQSWDALLYSLVNDTYLVRLSRLVNLLFCSLGIFTFLRLIRVKRFWSLVAVAGFLSIPELSYLALSLKVDSVVMMFELAAFLAIVAAFIIYWHEENLEKLFRAAFYLSLVALLLAAFAFGNRFSGIISMALCAGCAWLFLTKQTKRPFISLGGVLALFAFFIFIAAPGNWFSFVIYGNPIYPLRSFWPFQNGTYTNSVDLFRENWNIVGLPPVILQIYLIFALGVGLELLAQALPFLNCLPMAAIKKTSMGWPYPLILCIFFWPFFIKGNKVLNLIVGIFIFQLTCWSLGLHYSRLFVASSALVILAAVIMASQEVPAQDFVRQRMQKALRFWIIFSLILSLLFQLWWFGKRYWGLFLFGVEKRYHAQVGFLKTRDYLERNELTLRETQMLNNFFLNKEEKPVVYVLSFSRLVIHILFDKGIHVKILNPGFPYAGGGKYLLINPEYLKEEKTLNKQILLRYFPVHVLTTPDTKWELYTVSADISEYNH